MDSSNDFFVWLATQPACVEVAVGAFFCLAVAPVLLACFAMVVTAVENFAEARLRPLVAFLRSGEARLVVRLHAGAALRSIIARVKPSPHANS